MAAHRRARGTCAQDYDHFAKRLAVVTVLAGLLVALFGILAPVASAPWWPLSCSSVGHIAVEYEMKLRLPPFQERRRSRPAAASGAAIG